MNPSSRSHRFFAALCVGLSSLPLLAATTARAAEQAYPARPITIVVPAAAGGPSDTLARVVAQAMGKDLGTQLVIENIGGAGGSVGAAKVARARGDGYTLYLYHIAHATWPALYRKLPFDVIKDFEPVGRITDVPMTLVGKADLPAGNFKELVAHLKANSKKVNMAHAGLGSASHLCGLLFQQAIGQDLTTVAYKGTGPAITDLMGGQVDLMCDQTTNTTAYIQAGKIKVYGVTTLTRVPSMKNVPTLDELGLKKFELSAWHGLWAPKGTPQPVLDRLSKALQVALKDPDVIKRFADLGTVPVGDAEATPAALQTRLKSEVERWGPIIKAAGQYID